jgi:3-methyladenine DNA glycosylase AlkD
MAKGFQTSENMLQSFKDDMHFFANTKKAVDKTRFFKTQKGEYGFGDVFIGVSNPEVQAVCKNYKDKLNLEDFQSLISSEIHEFRFAALTMLVENFKKKKTEIEKDKIVDFYLKNINHINNWDLVDCSSLYILGAYLMHKPDKKLLYDLAKSNHLWSERIAIVSTLFFVRNNEYEDALKIIKLLIEHKNDLIHKANGWILREIWKRKGSDLVEDFLEQNIKLLPRTTLRYSIEKMEESKRQFFLKL